jgi:hypothetical protein
MKLIIKYISLLLFGGLILPFYNANKLQKSTVQVNPKAVSPAIEQPGPKKERTHFFIYQELAEIFLPELTN